MTNFDYSKSSRFPDAMRAFLQFRWFLFGIISLSIGLSLYSYTSEIATAQYSNLERADWAATNVWLQSAECFRQTGAWLAICEGEDLAPFANYSLADDPGHAFLLGVWAKLKGQPVNFVDVAFLNQYINFFGVMALAALLFALSYYVVSVTFALLGTLLFAGWIGISPHPGLVGASCFAAILPTAILVMNHQGISRACKVFFLALGLVLLGLSAMIREPIGSMGFLVSVGALGKIAWNDRVYRNKLLIVSALFLLVVIAWKTPKIALTVRDIAFSVPSTGQIQTHGISHNLYLGLGAVENEFGLRWLDEDAATAVRNVDPNIRYVSEEYYDVLWQIYLDRIAEDPLEVLRIYTEKARIMLMYRIPDWSPPIYFILLLSFGVQLLGRRRHIWKTTGYMEASEIMMVSQAFILFFIAQGVLAHHSINYALPLGGFIIILIASVGELTLRYLWFASPSFLARASQVGSFLFLVTSAGYLSINFSDVTRTIAAFFSSPIQEQLVEERTYFYPDTLAITESTMSDMLRRVDGVAQQEPTYRHEDLIVQPDSLFIDEDLDSAFVYLYMLPEKSLSINGYLLAEGTLYEGGMTLGLLENGMWHSQVNITSPGEFKVVIAADAGTFAAVLANNNANRNDTKLRVEKLGWLQN